MDWKGILNERPIMIAIAGSNGAGKTTFFNSYLDDTGLRFVNADELAAEFDLGPYEGAELADSLRRALVAKKESFVFETVLSDPVGDKVDFIDEVSQLGYQTVLIFIKIDSAETSRQRVSMRSAQGGHDVPDEKLEHRFDRTLSNLDRAIQKLPHVIVFDNSNLELPYRLDAVYGHGEKQTEG